MKCASCTNTAISGGLLCWICANHSARRLPGNRRAMSPEMRIKDDVCREMGITQAQLTERTRTRLLVTARRKVARRLRNELHLPLKEIAMHIGRSDHTTVMELLKERGPVLHTARKETNRE